MIKNNILMISRLNIIKNNHNGALINKIFNSFSQQQNIKNYQDNHHKDINRKNYNSNFNNNNNNNINNINYLNSRNNSNRNYNKKNNSNKNLNEDRNINKYQNKNKSNNYHRSSYEQQRNRSFYNNNQTHRQKSTSMSNKNYGNIDSQYWQKTINIIQQPAVKVIRLLFNGQQPKKLVLRQVQIYLQFRNMTFEPQLRSDIGVMALLVAMNQSVHDINLQQYESRIVDFIALSDHDYSQNIDGEMLHYFILALNKRMNNNIQKNIRQYYRMKYVQIVNKMFNKVYQTDLLLICTHLMQTIIKDHYNFITRWRCFPLVEIIHQKVSFFLKKQLQKYQTKQIDANQIKDSNFDSITGNNHINISPTVLTCQFLQKFIDLISYYDFVNKQLPQRFLKYITNTKIFNMEEHNQFKVFMKALNRLPYYQFENNSPNQHTNDSKIDSKDSQINNNSNINIHSNINMIDSNINNINNNNSNTVNNSNHIDDNQITKKTTFKLLLLKHLQQHYSNSSFVRSTYNSSNQFIKRYNVQLFFEQQFFLTFKSLRFQTHQKNGRTYQVLHRYDLKTPVIQNFVWRLVKQDQKRILKKNILNDVIYYLYKQKISQDLLKNSDYPIAADQKKVIFSDNQSNFRMWQVLNNLGYKFKKEQVLSQRQVDLLINNEIILEIDGQGHYSYIQKSIVPSTGFRNLHLLLRGYKLVIVSIYQYNFYRTTDQLQQLINDKLELLNKPDVVFVC